MGIQEINNCYLAEFGFWVNYNKKIFKRNVFIPNILFNRVVNERYKNEGIFKTVYSYDSDDIENANIYGDFYLDFDDKTSFDNVREDAITSIGVLKNLFTINPEDINIYYSGNKGLHLIVKKEIFNIQPSKNLNVVYGYIAKLIKTISKNKTIDTNIYDKKRLFRIPNSKHEKSGLYKIPISFEELKNLSSDQVKLLASNPRIITNTEVQVNDMANKLFYKLYKTAADEYENNIAEKKVNNQNQKIISTPPCIRYILEQGPIDGSKNHTLSVLTSFYKSKGLQYDEAYSLVSNWSNGLVKKGELNRTFNSIFNKNYKYGCNTLKQISVCNYDECPLMKGKRRNEKVI